MDVLELSALYCRCGWRAVSNSSVHTHVSFPLHLDLGVYMIRHSSPLLPEEENYMIFKE